MSCALYNQLQPFTSAAFTMNISRFANKAKSACSAEAPATSLLRRLGIQPKVALAFVLADWILFSGELFTAAATLPISILTGFLMGIWAYKQQCRSYGDKKSVAFIKSLLLAVLTAIPSPLGSFIPMIGLILPLLDSFGKIPENQNQNRNQNTVPPNEDNEQDEPAPAMRNVTPRKSKPL